MTVLIKAKQIKRMFVTYIRANGISVTAAAGSATVTTALTTAASSAGDFGNAVPVQVAVYNSGTQTEGFVTSTADNRVQVYDATTKKKLEDGSGGEVYGELSGTYTITFFKGDGSAYTFLATTSVDIEVPYLFEFHKLPKGAMIAVQARNVDDDADAGDGRLVMEVLTPTGTDTFPNLTKTPVSSTLRLTINGQTIDCLSGSGLTHAAKVITWTSATVGFIAETTDRVIAFYQTLE